VLVKKALEYNAGAIILAHNHPSGVPEPSQADISITKRIYEAMDLIEVKLLDHFVVSTEGVTSMAEQGLI
jgi:DNA repair protein RadC